MARRLPSDSEGEDTITPPNLDDPSGAVTPSTAATSIRGGRQSAGEPMDEDGDEEEEVVAPGTRSTPRRAAEVATSGKFLPADKLDLSSDLSEGESDMEVIGSKAVQARASQAVKPLKGKGKAIVLSSDDEEEEEEKATFTSDEDDEDFGVQKAKMLANSLSSTKSTVGSSLPQKGRLAAGKAVGKSIAKILKGKSVKPTFEVVVHKKASGASSSVATGSSATKRAGKTTSSTNKGKGKAKAIVLSSSSSASESEFELASDSDEATDEVDSDVAMEQAEFLSNDEDDDEDEENIEERAKKIKKMGKKPRSDKVKIPPRKGAHISTKDKAAIKKLNLFDKTAFVLARNHPEVATCWVDLAAIPLNVPTRAPQPTGLTQKLLPFQLEGLDWMLKQESGPWGGGMLADEMGMGKTIQTIALILSDYDPNVRKNTLVLAPTVAIIQWRNEIEKFTKGMKVIVFHGSNRIDNAKELEKYDIVLTSYAVLESGYRREQKGFKKKGKDMKEDSILHKIKWNRVILDEAHNIKDRACNTAKAAFALKSKFRWCLSGTPLQNRVGELYSLLRFIGADPFAYYFCKKCDCKSLHWLCNRGPCSECHHSGMQHVCYWNYAVLKPIQYGGANSGEGERAFKRLTSLLERLMLRRTKVERADDMGLPPRVVKVRRDYFTEEEEEMYQSLFKDVKRKFNTYADAGTILNNYSNLFTLITRMRQSADHPSLVTHSKTAQPVIHAPGDQPEDLLICRICLDEAEDAVLTSCRHIFCRECVRQYMETAIENKPECPVCHLHMTIDLDQEAIEHDVAGRQGILARIDPAKDRTSTKIEALVEELSKLRTEDHTLKSLVFSQFTSMLDLVARRLQLGGFKVVRLQGTMTPTARDNTIKYFTNNPDVTVFLISLKAGGVALNLTEASRVFILDPWWNPAVELQAMDRIHRIGQHRPVEVTRLIIENSIESRILELQKKKENLAASALGDDDKAMGRLTPEDLRFLFSL